MFAYALTDRYNDRWTGHSHHKPGVGAVNMLFRPIVPLAVLLVFIGCGQSNDRPSTGDLNMRDDSKTGPVSQENLERSLSSTESCPRDDAARERALQDFCAILRKGAEKATPQKRASIEDAIERLTRLSRRESMPAPPAITLDLLESMPDRYLNPLVCDYVHACLFDDSTDSDAALAKLPKGLQYAWHIAGIDFEIPNGGFNQFFFNTSGQYALDTLEALRAVGAMEAAQILEKAIDIFEKKFGRPASSRERWYGEWREDKDIDALERRFYKLVDSDATSFVPYIRKHPEQFVHRRHPAK